MHPNTKCIITVLLFTPFIYHTKRRANKLSAFWLFYSLTDEDEDQLTISDDELNDYYDMSNNNNVPVGLTDAQMMRLCDYDNEEQFSGFSPEPGHTVA